MVDFISQLKGIENKSVLVIGDVMIDAYIWGTVDRISPEAPVPVVNEKHTENRLGGASNVARNLSALKLKPIVCSVIGDDEAGNSMLQLFKENAISTEGCIVSKQRKTTVKKRVISGNHQILRIDTEQTDSILDAISQELMQKIESIITDKQVAAIIFEDYDKGVVTEALIQFVANIAEQKQIPVFVDPKKRNFLFYKNITFFKPNFKEFLEGTLQTCKITDVETIFALAKEFIQKQNISNIMITLSEHGIFIANKNEYAILPSKVRHVSDVSGAGDTVISTAIACFLAGMGNADIAHVCNIAAGLVCEQPGVVTIEQNELFENL